MTPHEQDIIKKELRKAITDVINFSISPQQMPKKKDVIPFILRQGKVSIYGQITQRCISYIKKAVKAEYEKCLSQPEGKNLVEYYAEENFRNRILRTPDHIAIKLVPRLKNAKSMTKLTYCLIRENRLDLMKLMYEKNLLKIEEVHVRRTIGNKEREIIEFFFDKNLVCGDNLMYATSYQKTVEDKRSMQVYLLEKGVSILGTSEDMNASPELDWIKEYAQKNLIK